MNTGKKAILVVSFGTSYRETLKTCIESIEERIREEFSECEIRRAFTSQFIIRKLAQRDGIYIDDTAEALQRLKDDGFTTVIVQPTHIIAGHEFDDIRAAVDSYRPYFQQLALGRPVLYHDGSEGTPDDYAEAVAALRKQLPSLKAEQAVVLMGHGSSHEANQAYYILQERLQHEGLRIFLANVEETPTIEDVVDLMSEQNIKHVTLMPFMLVAGDHAINDMAGDEEDSWKTILEQAGYTTDAYLKGLGENPAYQEIYLQHVRDVVKELNQVAEKTA